MSTEPNFAPIRSSRTVEVILEALPAAMSRSDRHPVFRSPEQLQMHPAMKELGWTGVIDEVNNVARQQKGQWVPTPILITASGIVLAGIGRWRSALFDGRHEINCIEYPLGEDEALQFIIRHHQPQPGWNGFIRIRLALTGDLSSAESARQHARWGQVQGFGKFAGG